MEAHAWEIIGEIDGMGGMIPAIEAGYPQARIARASYEYQQSIERKDRVVVGVNAFHQQDEAKVPIVQMSDEPGRAQAAKLAGVRKRRNSQAVENALSEVDQRRSRA